MRQRSTIIEYDDRWIIDPLRNCGVIGLDVEADTWTVLRFDSGFALRTSAGAELSPRSLREGSADRHSLDFWRREDLVRNLTSTVVSPVFFKVGSLRLGLENGWSLFVSVRRPEVPAELLYEDRPIWNRGGLVSAVPFPVVQLDRWTGREIAAPPWPERPADFDTDESDDINSR